MAQIEFELRTHCQIQQVKMSKSLGYEGEQIHICISGSCQSLPLDGYWQPHKAMGFLSIKVSFLFFNYYFFKIYLFDLIYFLNF